MSNEINPFSRESNASGQTSQQQHDAAQKNRTRAKSSWGWILGGLLAFFLLGLVCCGGFAYFGYQAGSGLLSAPVNAAVAYVSADEEIADKLGVPIESTSALGIQNYKNNNGNGGASVGFNVKGTEGTARVDGQLTLTAGTWSVEKLTVKFPDGTVVILPRDPDVVDADTPLLVGMPSDADVESSDADEKSDDADVDSDDAEPSAESDVAP